MMMLKIASEYSQIQGDVNPQPGVERLPPWFMTDADENPSEDDKGDDRILLQIAPDDDKVPSDEEEQDDWTASKIIPADDNIPSAEEA